MTIESDIFTNLKSILETDLTWVKQVESETPYVAVSDLVNNQIPLVQFYWDKPSVQQQQRGLTTTTAPLVIEIIAKDTKLNDMTQTKLFQYRDDVLTAIGSNVNLSTVPGFIQFAYTGRTYDVHTMQDWFVARLNFNALFQESFGAC